MLKRSEYGFFVKSFLGSPPTIYYNDISRSRETQRFTIFHELKHYVFEDEDDDDDDLAEFFARFFMCPIPYLMLKKIDTVNAIASFCDVSFESAGYASSNIRNRRERHGYKIFNYEIPLINTIEPTLIDAYKIEGIGDNLLSE